MSDVDTIAGGRPSRHFGVRKPRSARRGRRTAVVAAVTAAVIVGSVLAATHVDEHRRVAPIKPPAPVPTAEQIIAEGHLYDFGATPSGAVLTVWTNCSSEFDARCGHAWRLGVGRRPVATGIVAVNREHSSVSVIAGKDMFLLTYALDLILRVGVDGSVTSLTDAHCRVAYPPLKPGRLVWSWDGAFDLDGVYCPTFLGTGDRPDPMLNARSIAYATAFTADGRLWALEDNEAQSDRRQTIGTFDGARWRWHPLAVRGESMMSGIAAVGSTVVVLGRFGISVTKDGGGTWQEVTDPGDVARRLPLLKQDPVDNCCAPAMAFAGPSTLYVADGDGRLWRSTDLTTFRRVETRSKVMELKSAGREVFARVVGTEDLVRIGANGRVKRLTTR